MTVRTKKTADSLDMILGCLADERRRTLIECLSDESMPLELELLVQRVAEREEGGPIDTVASTTIQDIATVLSHAHLPKLDDADILEVDNERKLVQKGGNFVDAKSILVVAKDNG